MREEDRTIRNLLALYDKASAVTQAHIRQRNETLDGLYEGHSYDDSLSSYRQEFYRSSWTSQGKLIVMRLGYSHYNGGVSRSWTLGPDIFDDQHDLKLLEKHNKNDLRLNPPGLAATELEQLAWVEGERAARRRWNRRWKKKMGYVEDLVWTFECQSRRERQLWSRQHLVLGRVAAIVRDELRKRERVMQERFGPSWSIHGGANSVSYSGQQSLGPRVVIENRVFHFQGEQLIEGEPYQTFALTGDEKRGRRHWDDMDLTAWARMEKTTPEKVLNRMKTQDLSRHLADRREQKERRRKDREEREARKAQEDA